MSEYRLGVKWDQSRLSRLVVIWQHSRTIDEVCKRMGMMYSEVQAQSYRLRQMGVPLKRFKARPVDFGALKRLAEKHLPGCCPKCGSETEDGVIGGGEAV